MQVEATSTPLPELDADLHVVLLAVGEELPDWLASAPGSTDVKAKARKLAMVRSAEAERVLVAGIGDPASVDAEALRVTGALIAGEARRYEARSIACDPAAAGLDGAEAAAALTEGIVLGAYRFDRFRTPDPDDPRPPKIERLTLSAPDGIAEHAKHARIGAEATNRARDLQNLPANHVNPTLLAERATELAAAHAVLSVEILGRKEISAKGLGGLEAVSAGADADPKLITLEYRGKGAGEVLGLVGKAVTFDSGGISIKPSAGMQDMKMDMSGGAAVLEAMGAIAELGLELDIVATIPATENMPSGSAMRPGDIITQLNGKTVEVNNTDAEGRLILADALTWCVREQGADRVVDLATLTGAVLIALGSTFSALISNSDEWAAEVEAAATASGEITWRLPLHPEYKKLTTGTVADLTNAAAKRKAGTIYAGSFLEEFVDDRPWAHLDIAGTAWDTEREYAGSGPTGCGVRLLIALATALAGEH